MFRQSLARDKPVLPRRREDRIVAKEKLLDKLIILWLCDSDFFDQVLYLAQLLEF